MEGVTDPHHPGGRHLKSDRFEQRLRFVSGQRHDFVLLLRGLRVSSGGMAEFLHIRRLVVLLDQLHEHHQPVAVW